VVAVFNAPGFDDINSSIRPAQRKFKMINAIAMFDLIQQSRRMIGQGCGSIHIIEHVLKKAGVSSHGSFLSFFTVDGS